MSQSESSVNIMSSFSRWWLVDSTQTLAFLLILTVILPCVSGDDPSLLQSPVHDSPKIYISYINISYMDRDTRKEVFKKYDGRYGKNSVIASSSGVVMHALSMNKSGTSVANHYGCTNYINAKFPTEHWIALVERGDCPFTNKIKIATKEHNASAIVIYSNVKHEPATVMDHDKAIPSISVLLSQADGKEIAYLLDMGYTVHMQIIPGPEDSFGASLQNTISKTSVLFVSISFIVLMIISLAWLVFYYIQRFRYSHAKERLARRLVCAAKKAIGKIPQRTVRVGDKELDTEFDQCAVCIEPYKAHDVIRILPCRHVFHKSCVDPWLLDQRSCPMCKLDILRAFGMQIGGSQESVHHDIEARPVMAVLQEPEVSSSIEDTQTEEIKVLLVAHTCLHFSSSSAAAACDKVASDGDEASSSLLGAVTGAVVKSPSVSSLNSKTNRYSRSESSDNDESFISEMKSLIGKGKGRWHRKEKHDVDTISDIERLVNEIEAVNEDERNEIMIKTQDQEDVQVDSMDSSSTLSSSSSSSSSSEQSTNQVCVSNVQSDSEMKDEQINSDTMNIIINDDSVIQPAVVKANLQDDSDDIDVQPTT